MTALRLVPASHTTGLEADFAEHLRLQGLSENTVSAYTSDVRHYGPSLADAVVNPDAHVIAAARIVGEDAPARTRQRHLSSLAKFFEFANPGASHANPYREVKRPRTGVVLPEVVSTPEQARQMIAFFLAEGTPTSRMYAAAVALMAGAGLRVGEATSLRFRDLNLESRTLRVEGKGRKTRDVPLGDFVVDVLAAVHGLREVNGPRLLSQDRLVPVSTRSVQRAVQRAAKAIDAGRLHPHALRHGFATQVYSQEKDLMLTKDLLGHSSISTTQIYVHIADDRRVSAVNAAL